MTSRPTLAAFACAALAGSMSAQTPLQVGIELPGVLDLRDAAAADWVPGDSRDPAQVHAKIEAWSARVAPLQGNAAVRILLPRDQGRIPLLLAASQALRAQNPSAILLLAFDPEAEPIWDEAAWGAVQGGALLPQDLGPEASAWPGLLAKAQGKFPGRPWILWLPSDPGARLSQILGDGGRVVLPSGGPGAALAAQAPPAFTDVEGGTGALLLRNPRTGDERRWKFASGAWLPAEAAKDRHEVQVTAKETYDVGALLARVRAERLREALKIRTQEADLTVNMHIQAAQGPGADLGFRFRSFQTAGGPEETLQKEILFNGVKAKINNGLQLPIIESRTSLASPAALTLTERYHYQDGGPGGEGRRLIRFAPVGGEADLFTGTLLVEESTGRVLEERSSRSGLPGMVKSEDRTLTYGEAAPGFWRMVKADTFERWIVSGAVVQIQRTHTYSGFLLNEPTFEGHRQAAVASNGTMLRQTPDGLRYFNKQKDGTRRIEERPRSSGKALGGVLLMDPSLPLPVIPLGGLFYYDYNAFNKGVQITALTAILFNRGQISIPDVGAGFSFSGTAAFGLLPSTERPIRNGHLVDGEGVGRRSGTLELGVGHDLGAGFRLAGRGEFRYDHFQKPWRDDNWTPGFMLPPSGWNNQFTGELSWLHKGVQLKGYYGEGTRPEGIYGLPSAFSHMDPNYSRWGGSAGLDYQLPAGQWLHGEVGYAGGKGFDRFQSLEVGGLGGETRIAGIRSNAITADQLTYAKAGVVVPTGPRLRLTLSLDQAWVRTLDNQKTYAVTGLGVAGDLPGFWWFTSVRVDLGVGLLSTLPGVRSCNGFVALLRVF